MPYLDYNEKEGVVVAADITSEANDRRQMLPMLEKKRWSLIRR